MSGYGHFAAYYDALMQNADHASRARACRDLLARYGVRDGLLLDLACGTGSIALQMASFGYDVIAVDASEAMLAEAQQKASESGVSVLFLCQRMQDLDLYGTVRGTICTLDSLNHLTRKTDFEETIRRVSLFTEPDGMFIFDVNTPYKHRSVLADNTFVVETEDVFCVWQNTFGRGNTVDITLDFFEKDGKAYYRSTERFRERAYGTEWICSVLQRNGFSVEQITDADAGGAPRPQTQRLLFAAKRKGN